MARQLGEMRTMNLGPDMTMDWTHDGSKITMTVTGPGLSLLFVCLFVLLVLLSPLLILLPLPYTLNETTKYFFCLQYVFCRTFS